MNEQSIGTARIDIVANTSTMEPGVAAARRSLSGLSTEASAQFAAAAASQKTMAEGMVKQINLIDKSRLEQIAYNAQLKIGGQLGQEIAAAALAKQGDLNAANAAALAEKQAAQEAAAAESLAAEESYQQERATIQAKWDAIRLADEAETNVAMSARAAARAAADVEAAGVDAAAFNAAVQAKQAALVRLDAAMAANLGTTEGMVEAEAALDEAMGVGAITAKEQAAAFAKLAAAETLATEATVANTEATIVNGAAIKLNSRAYTGLGELAGELASGNTSRLKFTLAALGNQTGLLKKATGALLSPIGLAVVGFGAFALASLGAYNEQRKLEAAIAQTNGSAGKSVGEIDALAASLSTVQVSGGKVKDTLLALAANGKIGASSFDGYAQAAVNMEAMTGESTSKAAADVARLFDGTVNGALKANEQYHFLTAGVIDHIAALQKQNDAQGAVDAELRAFNQSAEPRIQQLTDTSYGLAKAWETVWGNVKGAYGSFKNISALTFGTADLEAQLKQVNDRLTSEQSLVDKLVHPRASDMALRDSLMAQIAAREAAVARQANNDAVNSAGAQGEAGLQATIKAGENSEQKRKDALIGARKQADDAIRAARLKGDAALETQDNADYEKAVAAINAKYDKKTSRAKSAGSDPFASLNGLVQSAQVKDANFGLGGGQQTQQVQAILALVDAGAKLIQSGKDVARVQADVATGVTAVNDLYAKQADQLKKHNVVALDEYRAALAQQVADKQKQIDLQVEAIGEGAKEVKQQQALNAIYTQVDKTIEQLQRQRSQKGANTDYIDGEIAAQKASIPILVQQEKSKYAAIGKAQSDWLNGAKTAYADYVDQAANVAGQTQTLFTNAFKGMEDALVNFATTGKLNFKSLVASILTDLTRLIVKYEESQALKAILGAFLGSSGGNGQMATSFDSNGTFFSPYAKGGVFNSPSLSAYSGQVVSSPTTFAFARGAGVMGEAGPEAIMPLKRGPDGSLGVQVNGGAGAGASGINVTIQTVIQSNGSQQTKATSDGATNQLAKQLGEEVKNVVNQQLVRQSQPNGILWKMMRGQTA